MSKIRLFVGSTRLFKEALISLTGVEEINYLKNVMRCRIGDYIHIFNSIDGTWGCEIKSFGPTLLLIAKELVKAQSNIGVKSVSIAFSILKPKLMELIIQKVTELGIKNIYPLITKRSVDRSINIKRAENIIKEAAEQSGRDDVPQIFEACSLIEFVSSCKERLVVAHLGAKEEIFDAAKKTIIDDVVILVGPEGGFSDDEVHLIHNSYDAILVTLGNLVLRAETAAIISVSNYMMSMRYLCQ